MKKSKVSLKISAQNRKLKCYQMFKSTNTTYKNQKTESSGEVKRCGENNEISDV